MVGTGRICGETLGLLKCISDSSAIIPSDTLRGEAVRVVGRVLTSLGRGRVRGVGTRVGVSGVYLRTLI